jgi:hypothetical protein
MKKKSSLLGVTYSEFDNRVGPQLLYAYPEGAMTRENFETLSDYVIVGKHLCGKIIAVTTDDLQFMNFSVAIDNSKYERNTLLFSFGFVLQRDADMEPFEPVLRKLTSIFVNLEMEREYLFQEATKSKVLDALQNLYEQLTREGGSACLDLDTSLLMSVQLFGNLTETPIEIRDHHVPILLHSKSQLSRLPWDITLRHFLGYIDGVSHVKKIANTKRDYDDLREDVAMDIECIKRAIRVLSFYNCIIIADALQFTNVYQLTTRAKCLLSSRKVLRDIRDFCFTHHLGGDDDVVVVVVQQQSNSGTTNPNTNTNTNTNNNSNSNNGENEKKSKRIRKLKRKEKVPQHQPSLAYIAKLLLQLRPGFSLRNIMASMLTSKSTSDCKEVQGIDLRKLLAIAQERHIISRKHEFPFYSSNIEITVVNNANAAVALVEKDTTTTRNCCLLKDLLIKEQQNECLDQICCSHNISHNQLVSCKNVLIIYK